MRSTHSLTALIFITLALLAPGAAAQALGFSWPKTLNTDVPNGMFVSPIPIPPTLATDGLGNWVVAWPSDENLGGTAGTDADIFVSRSTDNGATWTPTATLNTNATTDSGWDRWCQVTTDSLGNWVAVWISYENLGGTAGTDDDVFIARSTDNGMTWTDPATLNTNADTDHLILGITRAGDSGPHVATDGLGNWVAVWVADLTTTIESDIMTSRSTDNGATWTDPAPLNTNADTDHGGDLDPQVTTDGMGNWVAVWVSDEDLGFTAGMDRDIFVARSTDNGATWTDPATLNTNADTDNTSNMDGGPNVATDGLGNWVAVWGFRDTSVPDGPTGRDVDIFVARSTDNGATWTDPAFLNTDATTDSEWERWLRMTTDGLGNWLAIWSRDEGSDGGTGSDNDLLVALSTDNGATWTDPDVLTAHAHTDSGWDWDPTLATDGLGRWIVVWKWWENLNGQPVGDTHLFVSTSDAVVVTPVREWNLYR